MRRGWRGVSGVVMHPKSPVFTEPSPYCAPYMPRSQAEMLLALVRSQPQKKWRAVERNLLKGLRRNANGKEYPDREPKEG